MEFAYYAGSRLLVWRHSTDAKSYGALRVNDEACAAELHRLLPVPECELTASHVFDLPVASASPPGPAEGSHDGQAHQQPTPFSLARRLLGLRNTKDTPPDRHNLPM
ncbi:MAG: hypothetical protein U0637_00130 [Phycisphaerales bacterium]